MSQTSDNFAGAYSVQSDWAQFNAKLDEIKHALVGHGFGKVTISISVHKGNMRTIVIEFGKSYIYNFHLSETRN
jgi:hypothetical protein